MYSICVNQVFVRLWRDAPERHLIWMWLMLMTLSIYVSFSWPLETIISEYKCTHVCNYVVPCHHIGTAWRPSVLSSLPILEHSSIWQIQYDRIKRLRSKSSQYHGAFHYQIVRASIWTERTTRWRNLLMSFVDRLSSEERLDISMIKCSAAEAIKNPKLFLWLNQLQLSHYKKCAIANAQIK